MIIIKRGFIRAILNKTKELEICNYKKFEFEKINFLIILCSCESFYSYSTAIDGYDIYLHKDLSVNWKRRILFHEILEIYAREQGLCRKTSHCIAKKEELKIWPIGIY